MAVRHWEEVLKEISSATQAPDHIQVAHLENAGLFEHGSERPRQIVDAVTSRACLEFGLVSSVECAVQAWEHVELPLTLPSNEATAVPCLIGDLEEIFDLLEGDLTALTCVLQSQHCSERLSQRAEDACVKLRRASEVLSSIADLQSRYMALEPIFRPGIVPQDELPGQAAEKFELADETWRLLMRRAQTTYKTVLHFTAQSTMAKQLLRLSECLQWAEGAASHILLVRRLASPRLWFLEDSRLLKAMANTRKQPQHTTTTTITIIITTTITTTNTNNKNNNNNKQQPNQQQTAFLCYCCWLVVCCCLL
ncbi:unnamed protein product [Polarella glacialis]|uniref:Dynein heavy chain linker domain-containing protein n=1 Tax=Polarella glacialis TaxID=89957 RepID=A0A813JXH0_POLGL|nr:unnamed protein product [Polarella glacialis]